MSLDEYLDKSLEGLKQAGKIEFAVRFAEMGLSTWRGALGPMLPGFGLKAWADGRGGFLYIRSCSYDVSRHICMVWVVSGPTFECNTSLQTAMRTMLAEVALGYRIRRMVMTGGSHV